MKPNTPTKLMWCTEGHCQDFSPNLITKPKTFGFCDKCNTSREFRIRDYKIKKSPKPKPDDLITAFERLLDYEANNLLYMLKQCEANAPNENVYQRIYQANYNNLVSIRSRLSSKYLMEFLDRKKFDMPEALESIYIVSNETFNRNDYTKKNEK